MNTEKQNIQDDIDPGAVEVTDSICSFLECADKNKVPTATLIGLLMLDGGVDLRNPHGKPEEQGGKGMSKYYVIASWRLGQHKEYECDTLEEAKRVAGGATVDMVVLKLEGTTRVQYVHDWQAGNHDPLEETR